MLTDELKITKAPTVSDELLKKMIGYLQGFPLNGYAEVGVKDVLLALQELLLARQRITELEAENRDWREDSERLTGIVGDIGNNLVTLLSMEGYDRRMKICEQHQALLEKYKTEVTP